MKAFATTQKCFFIALLVGVFVWLLFATFHPFEPRYQGKRLTQWAKEVCPLEPFLPNDWRSPELRAQNDRAVAAIQHIGAKAALPWALKLCRARDSWLKRKLEDGIQDWVNGHNDQVAEYNEMHSGNEQRSEIQVHLTMAADKQEEGGNIIWALGPKAVPAIPALIQLLQSQDETFVSIASYALRGIGTNAVPPLAVLVADTNSLVRCRTIRALGLFGSQARTAVPALVQYLESPDPTTRYCAADSLGTIKADAPLVVPALVQCLKSGTNDVNQVSYILALGRFGTNAKPAVPLLVNILKSDPRFPGPEPPVVAYRQAVVLGTLRKIDPEIAEPFFEKWKASLTNEVPPKTHGAVHATNPPSAQTNSASP